MKITVHAKPKKKRVFVKQLNPQEYIVSVQEPPVDGKANQAIIKILAEYFKVSKSEIIVISGATSKIKIIEIPDQLKNFEELPKQKPLF